MAADVAHITLIENEINLGFTKGNNVGLAVVPPEHDVLLLNNDTIIHSQMARTGARCCNDNVDYGIVGCRLLRTEGALQHAGTYIPTDTFWGYQIGGGEANIGQYPAVRKVEGIVGACMYIRRDVRAAIGGLDEAFFSYFEDTDYCLRAAQLGYKTVCVGDVSLIHRENTSTQLNNANWSAMFSRSQAIFRQNGSLTTQSSAIRTALCGTAGSIRHWLCNLVTAVHHRARPAQVDIRLACIWAATSPSRRRGTHASNRCAHGPRIRA
jgi:GT2 family glycosyltransferase